MEQSISDHRRDRGWPAMIELGDRVTPAEFDAAFDRWLLREHPGGASALVRWALHDVSAIDDLRARQSMHEYAARQGRRASRRAVTLIGVACLAIALALGFVYVRLG
jgi:hypothetical protein